MPYYIGEDMPEWDEYREWEDKGPGGERPVSLFKYIDLSLARTTVLPFPATPGPEPELPQDDEFLEETRRLLPMRCGRSPGGPPRAGNWA